MTSGITSPLLSLTSTARRAARVYVQETVCVFGVKGVVYVMVERVFKYVWAHSWHENKAGSCIDSHRPVVHTKCGMLFLTNLSTQGGDRVSFKLV